MKIQVSKVLIPKYRKQQINPVKENQNGMSQGWIDRSCGWTGSIHSLDRLMRPSQRVHAGCHDLDRSNPHLGLIGHFLDPSSLEHSWTRLKRHKKGQRQDKQLKTETKRKTKDTKNATTRPDLLILFAYTLKHILNYIKM